MPLHPFVPWVSPQHQHPQTCEYAVILGKKVRNSPIAVLAISVGWWCLGRVDRRRVRRLLDAVSRCEGTAGKALSQQRGGLPVRLVVC